MSLKLCTFFHMEKEAKLFTINSVSSFKLVYFLIKYVRMYGYDVITLCSKHWWSIVVNLTTYMHFTKNVCSEPSLLVVTVTNCTFHYMIV